MFDDICLTALSFVTDVFGQVFFRLPPRRLLNFLVGKFLIMSDSKTTLSWHSRQKRVVGCVGKVYTLPANFTSLLGSPWSRG